MNSQEFRRSLGGRQGSHEFRSQCSEDTGFGHRGRWSAGLEMSPCVYAAWGILEVSNMAASGNGVYGLCPPKLPVYYGKCGVYHDLTTGFMYFSCGKYGEKPLDDCFVSCSMKRGTGHPGIHSLCRCWSCLGHDSGGQQWLSWWESGIRVRCVFVHIFLSNKAILDGHFLDMVDMALFDRDTLLMPLFKSDINMTKWHMKWSNLLNINPEFLAYFQTSEFWPNCLQLPPV